MGYGEFAKSQTPSTKLQTNPKFQYPITETDLVRRRRIVHYDLFVICNFYYSVPSLYTSNNSLRRHALFGFHLEKHTVQHRDQHQGQQGAGGKTEADHHRHGKKHGVRRDHQGDQPENGRQGGHKHRFESG